MAQTPVRYVQEGVMIPHTPSAAVAAGAVVVQGSLVGIAKLDIEANRRGNLSVRGVFEGPKDASVVANAGVKLYWDADGDPVGGTADSGALTTTSTDNTFAGYALEAAGATVGTIRFLLQSA